MWPQTPHKDPPAQSMARTLTEAIIHSMVKLLAGGKA